MSEEDIQGGDIPVVTTTHADPVPDLNQPEPQPEPEAPEPEKAEGEGQPEGEKKDEPAKPHWQGRRIDELTRKYRDEERSRTLAEQQRDEMRAELERIRGGQQQPERPQPGTDAFQQAVRQEAERLATQQAQQAAAQAERERRMDVVTKGRAEYGAASFDAAADELARMGIIGDQKSELLDAIIESDVAPKLIHHLASNPDDAERLMGLSPRAQVKELARLEDKLSQAPAPKPASKVSAPLEPVKGQGKRTWSIYDPDIPQAEYEKLRGYSK